MALENSLGQTIVQPVIRQRLHSSPAIAAENPVIDAAQELLSFTAWIKSLSPLRSVEILRQDIVQKREHFLQILKDSAYDNDLIKAADFMLCTLIDTLVLETPWGRESPWFTNTLLSHFHHAVDGGEAFYSLLNAYKQNPEKYIDLIELAYICLINGFCGKYTPDSVEIRQELSSLHQLINQHRKTTEGLSERPTITSLQQIRRFTFPLTWTALICVCLCIFGHVAFTTHLNQLTDPVLARLEQLSLTLFESNTHAEIFHDKDLVNVKYSLEKSLAPDISQGLVGVVQSGSDIIIRLNNSMLFKPASTRPESSNLPDAQRLSSTIGVYSSHIRIVGHTDDSGKHQSNWALSRQRAEAIKHWLTNQTTIAFNIDTEGAASTQPVAENNSESGRAKNRRVDIHLQLGRSTL